MTAIRVTEAHLAELQQAKAHAAFKRSRAQDEVTQLQAQLIAASANLEDCTQRYSGLETSYASSTAAFHEQRAMAVAGMPQLASDQVQTAAQPPAAQPPAHDPFADLAGLRGANLETAELDRFEELDRITSSLDHAGQIG